MKEINWDVLQLTYGLTYSVHESVRDPRSVLVVIDDCELEAESLGVPTSVQQDGPVLVIRTSLKAINMQLSKSYSLRQPSAKQVTKLIKDFSRTHLGRINEHAVRSMPIYFAV